MSTDENQMSDTVQIEHTTAPVSEVDSQPDLVLVRPIRFLPRTHLLHLALAQAEWTLCGRSRVGHPAAESDLGQVIGGIETTLCTRCDARRSLLARGKRIGRS